MHPSVETRASWVTACAVLGLLSVSYGSTLLLPVAMKPIAEDLDIPRSAAAMASSLAWLGAGLGGIPMGWIADRIGMRRVTVFGAVCIALGLWVSSWGNLWAL